MNSLQKTDFCIELDSNVGSLLFVRDSSIARSVEKKKFHDPALEFFMLNYQDHLFPFFDVGANVGLFSILAAQISDDDSIFAIEPDKQNLELLKDNIERFKTENITIEPVGISSEKMTVKMGVIDCGLSKKSSENTISIDCVSIADLCDKYAVIPKFIKVDVEGAELDVIEGINHGERVEDIIVEIEFSWRDHHRSISRINELLPLDKFDYQFSLAKSEMAHINDLIQSNIGIMQVRDVRSGKDNWIAIVDSRSKLEVLLAVLEKSTLERSSRKWELCIAPKNISTLDAKLVAPDRKSVV